MTPRSFVRWEGTRFHEDEIVQLVRGAVGAGERIIANMLSVQGPTDANEWFGLTDAELPIGAAYDWAVRANCGAVVLFSGTIRDHAEGREGVEYLTYEAYAEQVVPKFSEIGSELRRRWPDTGRIVLLHRTGRLEIGESSVVAVVSAPHRGGAFEAARYAIDALKQTAPIWKHEVWADGADWGTGAHEVGDAKSVSEN
jgi:molybdopterin synthase catalytic subunit